jgi:hypothetical protein
MTVFVKDVQGKAYPSWCGDYGVDHLLTTFSRHHTVNRDRERTGPDILS